MPGRVVARERTSRWLGGALERLGIEVVVSDRLQALEPARAELLAQI
jgi:hypothetical protein